MYDVIKITAKAFDKVIVQDFIAQKQANHFKDQKENMPTTKCIVQMDFSMNYSTVIQDAVPAQHWSKEQASLHPALINYKDENNARHHKSFCFISGDVNHDVGFVYLTQRKVTSYIKTNLPWVTDGCAKQYKNKNTFLNLCRHEELFGLKATFSFFATSHGKSACDGIGGVVKRDAWKASLQRPINDQIIGAEKLFQFCKSKPSKIEYQYFTKEELSAARIELDTFGITPSTVPATRSFHHFTPLPGFTVACKRFSSDQEYALGHRLSYQRTGDIPFQEGQFALLVINSSYYFGLISDINTSEDEADVSLLTPHPPSAIYTWPEELLTGSVPLPHIICAVNLIELSDN